MKRVIHISAACAAAALCLLALPGQAQTFTDNAADPAYASGYGGGQNGGTGFGPFAVTAIAAGGGTAGTFVFTAAEAEGNLGTPPPATIDSGLKSFGFYAHGTSSGPGDPIVTITRRFKIPLSRTGDSFALDFVTGYDDGGACGVALTSSAGTVGRFQYQSGGTYLFNNKTVVTGYKTGALHLVYTLTSPTTYSFTSTGAVTYSGTGTESGPLTGFQVQQINASNGKNATATPDHNGYFNNLILKNTVK